MTWALSMLSIPRQTGSQAKRLHWDPRCSVAQLSRHPVNLVVAASTQPVAATKVHRFFARILSKADVFATDGGMAASTKQ